MSCRTPVIGTPAGAGQDILGQGGGVLIPIDDPVAMAASIVDFAKMDETTWKSISDGAAEISTRYSWENSTDRFEAALYGVVSQSLDACHRKKS
jgi:glycosyltransferase involved in cell wall biosynthesis